MYLKLAVPCALLALAAGCARADLPSPAPAAAAAPTPAPVVTPKPSPEPMTPERAAVLYARFLQDDIFGYYIQDDGLLREASLSYLYDLERTFDIHYVQDLNEDGIPELFHFGPGNHSIWTIQDGNVVSMEGLGTYWSLLPNGGLFYHRPGGAPTRDDHHYRGLSEESRRVPDLSFQSFDLDGDGINDEFYLGEEQVTEEEWRAVTDVYFALAQEEEERAVPFLDWVEELGVELPPPEMDEAKAERIFASYFAHEWDWHTGKDPSILRVWDFDGDGIPEVYEDEEPYAVFGIVGLHVEEMGTAGERGGAPQGAIRYSDW